MPDLPGKYIQYLEEIERGVDPVLEIHFVCQPTSISRTTEKNIYSVKTLHSLPRELKAYQMNYFIPSILPQMQMVHTTNSTIKWVFLLHHCPHVDDLKYKINNILNDTNKQIVI